MLADPPFRAKSPSFVPNPTLYSEALNASLQSALGFAGGAAAAGDAAAVSAAAAGAAALPFLRESMAASLQHQREREAVEKHLSHHSILDR